MMSNPEGNINIVLESVRFLTAEAERAEEEEEGDEEQKPKAEKKRTTSVL